MIYDLEQLTGFVSVANYSNPGTAHEMEIGAYKNLRFIETTEAKVFADLGGSAVTGGLKYTTASSACDVYSMLIFGMDAYGVVDLKGHAMKSIVKAFGAGDDPLNRVATAGWKAKTTCTILNDAFMCRYEAGVTA
jgi:N4-gp56 family major capsid protein